MRLKEGVRIRGMQIEILLGISIVESLFQEYGYEFVLTSCTDGRHMPGSLHNCGLAADIGTNSIDNETIKGRILQEGKFSLGSNFDFILEDVGTDNEHFHLEYDPKGD